MSTDAEFERYLRQFRPRAPRPLGAAGRQRWLGIAAMIAVSLALLATLRPGTPTPHVVLVPRSQPSAHVARRPESPVSMRRLRAISRRDPESLDRALDAASGRLLPDVEETHGVLSELARVSGS